MQTRIVPGVGVVTLVITLKPNTTLTVDQLGELQAFARNKMGYPEATPVRYDIQGENWSIDLDLAD